MDGEGGELREVRGGVGVEEAALDEVYGEVGDVDADPVALEAFGDSDGGAAPAEGIEHGVAHVTQRE